MVEFFDALPGGARCGSDKSTAKIQKEDALARKKDGTITRENHEQKDKKMIRYVQLYQIAER